jgi:RNA polymerase sigma-70 factor (ECF subfamily)
MKRINLKDYYAHINIDTYIDIPDEVFDIFEEHRKAEQAYQSKVHYHKAYYSLDRSDGIEHSALFVSLSPDEIYERKLTTEQLHSAIATLPDKQAKRIYAHYFLRMSKTAIAKAEGVNKSQVTRSISQGLSHLEKYLKMFCDGSN